ncbi:MAG: hypothetical protein ACC645_20675, partial [Pirellulales bacterium]
MRSFGHALIDIGNDLGERSGEGAPRVPTSAPSPNLSPTMLPPNTRFEGELVRGNMTGERG